MGADLLDKLNSLTPSHFGELLLRLGLKEVHFLPANNPKGSRALELLNFWRGQGRSDADLEAAIDRVIAAPKPTATPSTNGAPGPASSTRADAGEAAGGSDAGVVAIAPGAADPSRIAAASVRPRPGQPWQVVARPALEQSSAQTLRLERRLLLIGPRGSGTRTLAQRIVAESGLSGPDRLTELRPAAAPDTPKDAYFRRLGDNDPAVSDAWSWERWMTARAGRQKHLVVLYPAGAPLSHLVPLADSLRALLESSDRVHLLVAGGARAAELVQLGTVPGSLFSGMTIEEVPPLGAGEVRAVLEANGCSGDLAPALHAETGGLPGLLRTVLARPGDPTQLVADAIERLLLHRFAEDDLHWPGDRHSLPLIARLLDGEPILLDSARRYSLDVPETRLYWDGVLRVGQDGRLEPRCPGVRRAMEKVRAARRGTP